MDAGQTKAAHHGAGGAKLSVPPLDPTEFGSPIDFLSAEHERQLAVCDVLDRLVHNPRHGTDAAVLEAVRRYLVRDLPLHVADEEEDLFPLLRRRCPKSDDIEEIFELLQREHEMDQTLYQELIRNLEALIAGHAFADPAQFMMNTFVFSETQRRHLAWENSVILPRADRHLTEEDCAELGRRMAARRGIACGK
ncbi:MAG: hemerythrin domain-containing protein [Kiloniellaceae bacterium]